jgi:predicted alpha-1,6-mannanase (GH76 family)
MPLARRLSAFFVALPLLAACSESGGGLAMETPSGGAGQGGSAGNAAGGVNAGGTGTAGSAGSTPGGGGSGGTPPVKPDPFDTSVLELSAAPIACALSADRRELLVDVKNVGTVATPAIPVAVTTKGTTHSLSVSTPQLAPGAMATLRFARASLAGSVGDWAFDVTVDPDSLYGAARAPIAGSPCTDLRSRALGAMPVLYGWFDAPSGLFNGDEGVGEWWTGANMVEVTVDLMRETGDSQYLPVVTRSFEQAAKSYPYADDDFLNEYYDDEGWWALAWINAYDLLHDAKYLDQAKRIFTDMTGGWKADKCGGGLLWNKTKTYKSAISNELFLTVAARLHLRTPGDTAYLEWAKREWAWFSASGMIQANGQVVDGVNGDTCEIGGPPYTYNQGVIVGGLVELWRATKDDSVLAAAEKIAAGALANMTNDTGVFIEKVCDPMCGEGDGVQFKGVFARNLALLYEVKPKEEYRQFFIRQSDALWNDARSEKSELGKYWQGPFDMAEAKRQSAGLDALIGAVRVANMNLALRGSASGSAGCTANEGADRAIDGAAAPGSKWCSGADASLQVDLGAAREVVGFRVQHAGAGGEDSAWNTRDFELEVSTDAQTWTPSVAVTGNTANVTTHLVPAVSARYVRLHVTTPQTATDFVATRIYELEVFGSSL